MKDENPIRTLRDYSKPSHGGYRNTIELPVWNNVGNNAPAFILFSFRDQASNWLERLPTGSITTWEDLTTRFLAQFFPPGRTAKLHNDILMFQQHQRESLFEAWTRFKDLLQKVPHHGIVLWLQVVCVDDEGWFLGSERMRWKRNKSKDYDLTPSIVVTCTSSVQESEDAGNGSDAATATVSPSFTGPGVGLNPPPSTQEGNAPAGNAPVKPSYAIATGKPSGKKVNVRTLFPPGGNEIDVVVSVDSIRAISERFANTAYGFFLGKRWHTLLLLTISIDGLDAILENGPWFIWNNPFILKKWHPDENLLKEDISTVPVWVKLHGVPVTAFSEDGLSAIATKLGTPLILDFYTSNVCMQSWGRSSYARVMIELRANVELKDNIVVAMPKITREGHYTCNVHVEYEWKPPRCLSCKVFRHIHEECLKNTGAGKKKTVKKPSQTSRGVPNGVEPTIEVSNSNPFDILNSVDNDVEFDTNGGTTNLVNNGATSSGSSFMHIDYDGEFASNTPIDEKIDEIERQICEGKLRLLDNDGNLLVPTGIVESDSELEVIFDETANLMILTSGKDESNKVMVLIAC
nr:hypothetical protein [Tanacetum cinerariifolium]